jgi:hypothetical protein
MYLLFIRATCSAHLSPWLYHSNYIWRGIQVMKLIIQFSETASDFIPFQLKYSLSTLFSNTLFPCFSLNARDQVSYPYKTMRKLCIILFIKFKEWNHFGDLGRNRWITAQRKVPRTKRCYCYRQLRYRRAVFTIWERKSYKLRGLSPQANYTDRATAACWRS